VIILSNAGIKTKFRFSFSLPVIFVGMLAKDDLQLRWWKLEEKLLGRFGKKPDLEAVLFLIGIQEFGQIKNKFTKEQKQDLIHVAICSLLSQSGYYELEKTDEEGWPHFKQVKQMPELNMIQQENFLKDHILLYFESHGF
jgi:hypothetical protein